MHRVHLKSTGIHSLYTSNVLRIIHEMGSSEHRVAPESHQRAPAAVRHQGAVTEAAMSWQGKAPCDMPSGEPKSAGNIDVFEIGCASTVVAMMNNNRIIITLLVYITSKQNSNDSFMASACEAIDGIGRDPGHVTRLN